ncbi:arginase family protein [Micromonospora sp. CPCC 205371]|nr:arginase family protein [Micromonospora sp. CPCC 205371]
MNPAGWFLLGAPWDCSGTGRGEQAAPAALRDAGLSTLVAHDLGDADTVIDSRHRDPDTGVLALPETVRAAEALGEAFAAGLRDYPGRRPLVVGGDCSILLGILPALRRRSDHVGLWFVDGHPDYVDALASSTGETADLDLAALTGDGPAPLVALTGDTPAVPAELAVLIGHRTRDLDPDSAAELARVPAALKALDADVVRRDPAGAGGRAANWVAAHPAWVHGGLDVLDPEALPAVTYPQPGGPGWDDLAALLAPLARSPRLLGASVADFRPDLDPTGALAARIVALLHDVLP